jgi:hypothetical protein
MTREPDGSALIRSCLFGIGSRGPDQKHRPAEARRRPGRRKEESPVLLSSAVSSSIGGTAIHWIVSPGDDLDRRRPVSGWKSAAACAGAPAVLSLPAVVLLGFIV